MNKFVWSAILVSCLLMPPLAQASGQAIHLRIGNAALPQLDDQGLRELLQTDRPDWYKAGLSFPDVLLGVEEEFQLVADHFGPDLIGTIISGHRDQFLNEYVEHIVDACGTDATHLLNDETCSKLVAHYMGSIAHVVSDQRFDRYFLTRVAHQCSDTMRIAPGEDSPFTDAQGFTDGVMDGAISDHDASFSVLPVKMRVPLPVTLEVIEIPIYIWIPRVISLFATR